MATTLLNKTTENIFKTFLITKESGMQIKHSTTLVNSVPLLEDFVMFAEAQLRLLEITANPTFKQNFKDTLAFITEEFLVSDYMSTRAKYSQEFEMYPNQEYSIFDSSFKSPVSTYISLMRRASALFLDNSYLSTISELVEKTTQTILKINPLGAGEAMRALTYPDLAYRSMSVPESWSTEDRFIKFIPYFFPRFVISYHTEKEGWQICSSQACELKGTSLEEFILTLTPKENISE
jgi:uncharacterized protein YyaL (SSP411 family)